MSRTTTLGTVGALLALSGLAYACGSGTASADFASPRGDGDSGRSPADAGAAFPGNAPGTLAPTGNGVIVVHAASAPAFRLCFGGAPDLLPQPDSKVMPEANVVGVEIGSAVRIDPIKGASPGHVYLYEESVIRSQYPVAGKGNPCGTLLKQSTRNFDLGPIDASLASGVHLLAITGCLDTPLHKHTKAECGADFDSINGNLKIVERTLLGANRSASTVLPTQLIQLSQTLDIARSGRRLSVAFGDLKADAAPLVPIIADPALHAGPLPPTPVPLAIDDEDLAVYGSVGFRVTLADLDGGNAATIVDQSLADIQNLSAGRDVPSSYYAAASNYVLLLIGELNPLLPDDAGPDPDVRRALHFLAVPVIEPQADAGADAAPADAAAR